MEDKKYTSWNLTKLEEMFPDKLVLDVDDIAKAISISKSKIYKLSSLKQMPFKLLEIDGRIRASIYEVAMYLDGLIKIEDYVPTSEPEKASTTTVSLPVKKSGRPRKIDKVLNSPNLVRRFQEELKENIIKHSIEANLNLIFDKLSSYVVSNEDEVSKSDVENFISESKLKVVEASSNLRETILAFHILNKDDIEQPKLGKSKI